MGEGVDNGATLFPDGYRGEGPEYAVVAAACSRRYTGFACRVLVSCTAGGFAIHVRVLKSSVISLFTTISSSNSVTTVPDHQRKADENIVETWGKSRDQ